MKKVTIMLFLLLGGCSWFEDKRVAVKPKMDVNSPENRAVIRFLLENKAGNSWGMDELLADIEYQKYLMEQK